MKHILAINLLFLFFVSSMSFGADIKLIENNMPDLPGLVGYAPDKIVVKFDPTAVRSLNKAAFSKGRTGVAALDHIGERFGVNFIRTQFPGAQRKLYRGKVVDLAGWHKIKFSGKIDVFSAVEQYKTVPGVIDAQPIGIHRIYREPSEEFYYLQWHLPKIQAPLAWDIETGNPDIIVAILDTGVRYFQKDLGGPDASYDYPTDVYGNIWVNQAEKNGIDDFDDDGNGYTDDWVGWDFVDSTDVPGYPCYPGEDCGVEDNDPRDFNGHGTHCAGNVSAINDNSEAVASPAGGWGLEPTANGVKIMSLRIGWSAINVIFEVGLVEMDHAAEALYYAADNGARIASCSWGSGDTGGLGAATDYFLANGGMIFKAAGNGGNEIADYMAGRSDVITVAATDQNDCKASFSSYGNWVDISAPGVDIWSLFHYSADPVGDYVTTMDGTSMSAPLAASVAALIWSQNPDWTAGQVKQKLLDSADPIDSFICNTSYAGKLGTGRINAYRAVNNISPGCNDVDGDGFYAENDCGTDRDCNDNDTTINPGAVEVCDDAKDNDCNGLFDSQEPVCGAVACTDNDGDGFYAENNCGTEQDCDDNDFTVNPEAQEVCGNGIDENCDGYDDVCPPVCTDMDGDGYSVEGGDCGIFDCNDAAPDINPDACDIKSDGIDQDCSGADRRTGKPCPGSSDDGGDTSAKELVCDDGKDNDGDGLTDCDDKDCKKYKYCR